MRRTRRQTVLRVFEIAGASLVLLDALLYFAVFQPVQAMVSSQQEQYAGLRHHILEEEVRIEHLKTFLAALPNADERLVSFEKDHAPPRRQAFSRAAKLLHDVTEASGTVLVSTVYKLDASTSGPLRCLSLVISVEGPFPGLLKFAHALETTTNFLVIRSFSIAPGENAALSLRMVADLYLMP